jgi:hypothetical protein
LLGVEDAGEAACFAVIGIVLPIKIVYYCILGESGAEEK